jgi:ABC-type nitrate/sulfonate/bicarbonate transport system permease component
MSAIPSDIRAMPARTVNAVVPLVHRRPVAALTQGLLSRRSAERIVALLAPLALLALWELSVRVGWLDKRFFPAPLSIVGTFYYLGAEVAWTNSLLFHTLKSLSRAGIGFVLGAIPAIALGIVMGLVPMVRAAVQPMVGALFPIPKVAILPLIMLIFGIGEESKWAIIAVGVFFQVLIATAAGVANIDKIFLDVGRNFEARRMATYWNIALPGALPMIFAGVRLGWGVALLLLVTAEMVSSQSGLGFMIWRAWQLLSVEDMYVGLVTIAAIGIVSFWLLDALEAWLLPWKARQ